MAIQDTSAVSSAAANGKHGHSLISDQKFQQLYTLALELHFAAAHGAASLAGREAVLAAVSADLHAEDVLISEHPWPLAESSGARTQSGQPAYRQPVFGERVVEALSAALADRMRRSPRITVLLFPEQWASDVLPEARAIASAIKLPIIFVEQGNENATPARRTKEKKGSAAEGMISIPVDAHDVIALYRVAHESITRARHGSGPTRIVCLSLQAAGDEGSRMQRDGAVANLENWLLSRGLPVEQWRQEIVAKCAGQDSPAPQDGGESIPQSAA